RRLPEAHARHRQQVVAVPLEQLVRRDADHDDEVTGRAAALARLALTADALDVALLDPGRDLQRDRHRSRHGTVAAADRAARLDRRAGAVAARTGLADRQEALVDRDLPDPAAGAAGLRLRAGFGTRAAAGLAALR